VKVALKRVTGEGRKEGKGKEPPSPTRFENFWETWPKSERKQDKSKCMAKWTADGFDEIADAIFADIDAKKLTRKWMDNDGQFIEAPLVYLNNRRWEDGSGSGTPANNPMFAGML
jgi:hypothetical protein